MWSIGERYTAVRVENSIFRTAGPGARIFRGQHCSRVAANEDIRQHYDMCDADILLIFYLHS